MPAMVSIIHPIILTLIRCCSLKMAGGNE
ncbi:hypothetical protein KUCAC02_020032 [Chaenocephalus aceratus]|uniref:Uncharacterized protein n=1 Tax=Chaenocephalus aceratus TaxID=36190 RepID=A0ACB9VQX8_CHAAC|nr:hypothetical protein KUCAC02_020032 [Chaenocephalus aceratus]